MAHKRQHCEETEMPESEESSWIFEFAVESKTGEPLRRESVNRLLEDIVKLAESHGLQMGGGYRRPTQAENNSGPIFAIEDDGK